MIDGSTGVYSSQSSELVSSGDILLIAKLRSKIASFSAIITRIAVSRVDHKITDISDMSIYLIMNS